MKLLAPSHWTDYELLDSGSFEKLERFGAYIVRRPEPQAIWDKMLPESVWKEKSHATFRRSESNPEKGEWQLKPAIRDRWNIRYSYKDMNLVMRLGLTAFRHLGIFPEQAENWNYIFDSVKEIGSPSPRVLNLFAYTGGASLAARAAGAQVVHLDSVKQVVSWARENMEASGMSGIQWIVEDAVKFVSREVKRGKKYHGIILDPPAYGRGPSGEKWLLESGLNELLKRCNALLEAQSAFVVLNLYSMGFSALVTANLVRSCFPGAEDPEYGELYLQDQGGRKLPLGIFARFRR